MPEREKLLRFLPWVSTPLLLVLTWYAWKATIWIFGINPITLPYPEDVRDTLWEMLFTASLWNDVRVTMMETIYGFSIALVTGLVVGTVLGRVVWLERALQPMIVALQVVPKVAFVPMFIIWFGFGMTSKIILSAILGFFPIMLNVLLGVRSVEPGHVEVMRSLNASRWATFWRLELHSTLPYIFAGMEVGIVFAVIGAIVGEYLGGSDGLGYQVIVSLNSLDASRLFAVLVLLAIIGFLLFFVINILKRIAIPWHQSVIRAQEIS